MSTFPLPLTQLVHENLSVVMTFAFSRGPLEQFLEKKFEGEWKYLRKFVFDISEARAIKGCIELAVYLRALDDEEKMSAWLRENSGRSFGLVTGSDGSTQPLGLREVANKIIHAASFAWDFSTENRPLLMCAPRDNQRWRQANIDIVAVAAFCGGLMS
jgi:hypothetical protein